MPRVSEVYPTRYLQAQDLQGRQFTLSIFKTVVERLGQGPQAEDKLVVYFNETEKVLPLNKTNANTIAALHGDDTDHWKGKRITVYPTEVTAFGETHQVVRVNTKVVEPQPKSKPAPAPAPAPSPFNQEEDDDDILSTPDRDIPF